MQREKIPKKTQWRPINSKSVDEKPNMKFLTYHNHGYVPIYVVLYVEWRAQM